MCIQLEIKWYAIFLHNHHTLLICRLLYLIQIFLVVLSARKAPPLWPWCYFKTFLFSEHSSGVQHMIIRGNKVWTVGRCCKILNLNLSMMSRAGTPHRFTAPKWLKYECELRHAHQSAPWAPILHTVCVVMLRTTFDNSLSKSYPCFRFPGQNFFFKYTFFSKGVIGSD